MVPSVDVSSAAQSGSSKMTGTEMRESDRSGEKATFTLRAVAVGLALTAFYAWFHPVSRYRFFSSDFDSGILPPGVVFLGLALVAANALIARTGGRSFSAGELVVAFSMAWLGASSSQLGLIGNFLSVMSGFDYFASPENRWADYYSAHLPSWITPGNHAGGVRLFYNGLPSGASVPWEIWLVPLFWWGSLIAATLAMVIALMAIVHEQWHDHEKLAFPMADIPLALVGAGGGGRAPVAPWLRSRLFWYGASLPIAFMTWNMLHFLMPEFPFLPFSQITTQRAFRHLPDLYTKVDFFTIGLAYFASLPVLLGLWLGRILIAAEIGIMNRIGITAVHGGFMPWSEWGSKLVAWQCLGGLFVFVLWGFWTGREHFGKVFRAAVSADPEMPIEIRRRYRIAVWGLGIALLYISFWFNASGMSWPVVGLFVPILVLLTIGMSKVVVESSLLFIDSPVNAQSFVVQSLGTANIPQAGMAAIVISYAIFRSNQGLMMPQVAFASRMGDERGVPRGSLYAGLGIAVLLTIVVAVGTTIVLAYDTGALNFSSHAFQKGHVEAYAALASASDLSFGPDWQRLGFLGAGVALMAGVIAIRIRFVNFWLHPIGLAFATSSVASLQMMNLFLAWLAKTTLMRLGGHRLVERAKPFFLGLLCGHAIGLALGIVVDMIFFPGAGHDIPTGW